MQGWSVQYSVINEDSSTLREQGIWEHQYKGVKRTNTQTVSISGNEGEDGDPVADLVPTTHRDPGTGRARRHSRTPRGRRGDTALALADQEREDDGVEVGHELLVHVDADAPFGEQAEAPVVRLCCDRVGLRV